MAGSSCAVFLGGRLVGLGEGLESKRAPLLFLRSGSTHLSHPQIKAVIR